MSSKKQSRFDKSNKTQKPLWLKFETVLNEILRELFVEDFPMDATKKLLKMMISFSSIRIEDLRLTV